MNKLTIKDIDLSGKRVLLRVDYNVPIKDGVVGDTLRIEASFPTIKYLLEHDCSIVLMSHMGRPDGKVVDKYSLAPVAKKAAEMLDHKIEFLSDCIGDEVKDKCLSLKPGEIVLLENLRFHPEEEANDAGFSKELADLGEIYVDDAFAAIHRAHASTVGVTKYLDSVAGLLVEQEIDHIKGSIDHPDRPLVAIVGGAKVSTKIDLLKSLIPKVDVLMIGGAMANTFYIGEGFEVGKSIAEPDYIKTVKELLAEAKQENTEVLLPTEVVISKSIEASEGLKTVQLGEVGKDDYIVDASDKFAQDLDDSAYEFLEFDSKGTVIWNGPIGITEIPAFAKGSRAIADVIIKIGSKSVIGGGDTAAFVDEAGLHDKFTWVSTGGGASLELMSGMDLPGVEALKSK
jgi:phosphoglycerate kinase